MPRPQEGESQEDDPRDNDLLNATFSDGMGKLSENIANKVIERLKINGGNTDGLDYEENSFKG